MTLDAAAPVAVFVEPRSRSLTRSLVLAALGCLAYGGWAAYANSDHGTRAAVLAGLTQGAISFVTTFCLTVIGDAILRRFRRGGAQLAATVVITPAIVLAVLASIHTLAGTPDVVETILPSVIGGTVFCTMYVAARRARIGRPRAAPVR